MAEGSTTSQLQGLLDRLKAGDDEARKQLINRSCERLRELTHRMFRNYPRLRRREQTDDVLQNSSLRLYKSLSDVRPDTVGKFFGLAATQIRRELRDLCRKHFGPEGTGRNVITNAPKAGKETPSPVELAKARGEPATLDSWARFHDAVEKLPEEERQVVDLLYYQDLPQAQAATHLDMSVRTIKRRWQAARLKLHKALRNLDG